MILAAVIIYLTITVVISIYLSRRIKSTSDFLIAGRNLGLLLTTATLAAIQIGAGVVIGGAEMGADSGVWPGTWYGIGCGGGLILAGLLVASRLRKLGGFVPLDFFSNRYGERRWVRVWAWLSNIPSLLGIFIAQIMAAGSVFSVFGLDYTTGILVCGFVVMLYSVCGGMWSVAVTNFIQLAIIVIGIPMVAVIALLRVGQTGGVAIAQILGTSFIPAGMGTEAVFVIVPFLIAISVSYDAYMRYQSARSGAVAKWGCILGGLIVMFVSFCSGLIGATGRILFPELAGHSVLARTVEATLPPILAGVVVSSLLAAAMSTANCLLVSLAGTFTRDLYNKVFHPTIHLNELKYSKHFSRIVIVVSLCVGLWIAFRAKGILYTIIIFNYPYMGSMLVPLLAGVLWKGATWKGACSAIMVGGILGLVSFLSGIPGPLHGLFNVDLGLFVAYVVSAIVLATVSLATRQEQKVMK